MLNEIGMIWNINDENWYKNYNLAKLYYEHNGDLKIASNFKTINGYEPDENGIALGNWINSQRKAYSGKGNNVISNEKIKLLEEIGMIWFTNTTNEKLQQEQITPENLERKKIEIQNRFYSVLNNHDSNSLPSSEELNQEFLEQLNTGKKM